MSLESELDHFDQEAGILSGFVVNLSAVGLADASKEHLFLAEAVIFRYYRIYERLVRIAFLSYCVREVTLQGVQVKSKLKCETVELAEAILKSGNKFLDWGNVESTRKMANLVFDTGFPLVDFVSPISSALSDLQRFRNFVAHDSEEAAASFRKSRQQYVRVGDDLPESVGSLALYRRSARADTTIKIIADKVASLSNILRAT